MQMRTPRRVSAYERLWQIAIASVFIAGGLLLLLGTLGLGAEKMSAQAGGVLLITAGAAVIAFSNWVDGTSDRAGLLLDACLRNFKRAHETLPGDPSSTSDDTLQAWKIAAQCLVSAESYGRTIMDDQIAAIAEDERAYWRRLISNKLKERCRETLASEVQAPSSGATPKCCAEPVSIEQEKLVVLRFIANDKAVKSIDDCRTISAAEAQRLEETAMKHPPLMAGLIYGRR